MNKFLKIIHLPGLAIVLAVMSLEAIKPVLRRKDGAKTRSGEIAV